MSSTPQTAVSCRGVTKEFGQGGSRMLAVRGADLDVYLGELTLMVGPSGCGKTTLLSVIAGILDPTDGKVSVLGADMERMPKRKKIEFRGKNIGFVFQQFNLLPALTAAENAAVPLIIAGVARKRAVAKAKELLTTFGLAHRVNAFPSEMSGGEQQRVAIARALVHEPKLMVCDEPTSALDEKNGKLTMELLKDISKQRDRAVIVVTHDARVFHFGDRIAYMNDGQVVKVETKSNEGEAVVAAGEGASWH